MSPHHLLTTRRGGRLRYLLAIPLVILTALAIVGPIAPEVFVGPGDESLPAADAQDCYSFVITYTDGHADKAGVEGIAPWCGKNNVTDPEFQQQTGIALHAVEIHVSCSDPGLTNPAEQVEKSDLGGHTVIPTQSFIVGPKKTCGTPFTPGDPDVVVSKSASDTDVTAGDPITYTITAQNVGTTAANDVVVTDDLDDDLDNVTASVAPTASGTCVVGGGNSLTCNLGTLDVNETVTITVSADTTEAACPQVDNISHIAASNEPGANQGNNDSAPVSVTVNCPPPDVIVSKTASTAGVTAGDPYFYTLTVQNVGQGDAENVVVRDNLDDDLDVTATSVSPANTGSCTVGVNNAIECDLGTVPAGATRTIRIDVDTTTAACPEVVNRANVRASNEPSANEGNNQSAQVTVDVNCQDPNVRVSKTASTAGVVAGDSYSYTLTAENVGQVAANNVVVTDNLDDDLDVTSISPAAECTVGANNTVRCEFATLAAGASRTITIQVTSTPAACPEVVNRARISATNEPAANQGDNQSDQVTVDVTCQDPDVIVSKTASATGVTAGDPITYTITARNVGQVAATGVVVRDNLDDDLNVTSTTVTPSGTCTVGANNTIECDLGTLDAGATRIIRIRVNTTPAACPEVVNRSSISATNEPAANQGNNQSGQVTVDVDCDDPDVVVSKTASRSRVDAGDAFSYTLTARNIGAVSATGVVVRDNLDDDLRVISVTASPSGTCTVGANNLIECDLGTLAAGATRTITIEVDTDEDACPEVVNRSSITATNEPSANQANNQSERVTVDVDCDEGPDVVVRKNASESSVDAGDRFTYTLTVENIGDVEARDVIVTDDLDDDLDIDSISVDQGDCDVDPGNEIECDIGDLDPDEEVDIRIRVTAERGACPEVENRASVEASNESSDDDDNNRSNRVTVDVDCPEEPDVTISKTASTASVDAGGGYSYTLTARNVGDTAAEDVIVRDDFDDDLEIDDIDVSPAGTCDLTSGNRLECDLGTLDPGERVTITIDVTAPEAACPGVVNRATIEASNEGSAEEDNNTSDPVDVDVICPEEEGDPDVRVVKSALFREVDPGQTFDYFLSVFNLGDEVAEDVTITDDLPDGLTAVSATAPQGSCETADGNLVECFLGSLAPGDSLAITLRVTVAETACGPLPNVARVDASNEPAANQGNNNSNVVEINVDCIEVLPDCRGNLVVRVIDESTGNLIGDATVVLDDSDIDEGIGGSYVPPTGEFSFRELECGQVDGRITEPPPGDWLIVEPSFKTVTIEDEETAVMEFFVRPFTEVLPRPPTDRPAPPAVLPRTGSDLATGLWTALFALTSGSILVRGATRRRRVRRQRA